MICFIHMERAGGTTLHSVFRNNWPFGHLALKARYYWSNVRGNELSPTEMQAILRRFPWARSCGGHTVRHDLGYRTSNGQPLSYVTFLREPISRYTSHFNFQCERMGKDWTIDSFANEDRFNNCMTRRLAEGVDDLDRAIEALETRFRFVGVTERFDESLILMKDAFGLEGFDTRYATQNGAKTDPIKRVPVLQDQRVRDLVREKNELDIALYQYAVSNIFPRYVAAYQGDLQTDISVNIRRREQFRYRPVVRYASRLFPHLCHRHLEWYFHSRHAAAWRSQRLAIPT